MITAIRVILILGFALLQPLVLAFSASTLWRWFVQADYGVGPSYAAWYGIFTIVALLVLSPLINLGLAEVDKETKDDEIWTEWKGVGRSFIVMFAALISLPVCWLVGQVLGFL